MGCRSRSLTAVGAALGLFAGAALACGEQLSGATRRIDSPRYEIVFASVPEIATGVHFSLDVAVCPRGDAPRPDALRVDAVMPEHRHGMNYRPVVVERAPGLYRADGLMLHMPGHWELRFDIVAAGESERLSTAMDLK